jgi:hypothetical protein
MAMRLPNSMFIHIPKCGGRWAKFVLKNYAKAKPIGDDILESHATPDYDGPVFCIIREPAAFAHSLWHHRARKKANKNGKKFNWQSEPRLEVECRDEDYQSFMNKVAENKNAVHDYYMHFVSKYSDVRYCKQENLAKDLANVLEELGEKIDRKKILGKKQKLIGKGPNIKKGVEEGLRIRINNANAAFCKQFGYKL